MTSSRKKLRKKLLSVSPEVLATLVQIGEEINATLDLDEVLARVAELVKKIIPYEIFATMLLHERTQELRIRFAIGHKEETMRMRVPLGKGITGTAAAIGRTVLANDVRKVKNYINALPSVRSELAVPLILKNRCIGVLDIQSSRLNYFTEYHRRILTLLAGRIATAIDNARLHRRTIRQAQSLGLLNDIGRELSSILHLDTLLRKIAELVKRVIDYQFFFILLLDEQTQELRHYLSVKYGRELPDKTRMPLGVGITGTAAATRQPILVPDVGRDPRYVPHYPETRSELAVPLIFKDRVIGVVDLESPQLNYFTENHVQVLTTLAPQIAIAIENAQLYERVARGEARLEKDLEIARDIQNALLPGCCPEIPGLEIGVRYDPARTLGGDLYDFLPYGECCLGIAVGDVTGKGTAAALYGMLTMGTLRTHALGRFEPAEMLRLANESLCQRKIQERFATVTYAVWDYDTHTLALANAGMPHPLLLSDGKCERIPLDGLPLGIFEDARYEERNFALHPGDLIVFYSDGIVETTDARGREFGLERLRTLLAANGHASAPELVDRISREVERFGGGRPQPDDRTIVVVRVTE